jgi:septal ring factor EnvC (AmiA/AmiB activator)
VRLAIIAALIIAIAAAAAGWILYSHTKAAEAEDQKRITELQQQLAGLQSENAQLKENLAKSQSEEERLSSANQELAKMLAKARLSGKVPPLPPGALPFPPK